MVNHRGEVSLLILGSLCLGPETFFSQRQNALICNVKLKNGSNSQLILGCLHVTPSHQDPEQNALLLHVVWVISADVVTPCETQFGENTPISFPMFGGKKKKLISSLCRPLADRESHYEEEDTSAAATANKKRKTRTPAPPPSKKKRRS